LRLDAQPEVERAETYLLGFGMWHKPGQGGAENCTIVGSRLDDKSLGLIREASPEARSRLSEPGTVLVDEMELSKLGVDRGVHEFAEVNQQRVRVVGTVHGFQGFTAPYVFCSLQTARRLLPAFEQRPGLTMHVLARCRQPGQAAAVVQRLRSEYPDMGSYTREEFSRRSRLYWLIRSSAGTVMICTVLLALLVGIVVTRQTLYAATLASLREYAVLDALGIPRRRLVFLVLAKSFWIGLVGVAIAVPVIFALSRTAGLLDTQVLLPGWLLCFSQGLTLMMALVSGVSALRSLRQVEPATLLR
jgi:putative ABC transport system permease protein